MPTAGPPSGPGTRFLLLYGSQTGQAKAIAEEIADNADKHGLHADIHCFSQTEKRFYLERERCVVIVMSTTGDGEPPDTVQKFWRRVKKKTLSSDHLSQLNFALLGLGDSNYTNFCNCAKSVDRRLEELGAKRFYSSGWADDAVGLEVVVEPWMEGLWPALKKFLGLPYSVEESCVDTEIVLRTDNQSERKLNKENDRTHTDHVTNTDSQSDRTSAPNVQNGVTPVENVLNSDNKSESIDGKKLTENPRIPAQNGFHSDDCWSDTMILRNGNKSSNSVETDVLSNQVSAFSEVSDRAGEDGLNCVPSQLNGQEIKCSTSEASETQALINRTTDQVHDKIPSSDLSENGCLGEERTPISCEDVPVSTLRRSVPPLCDNAITVPVLTPAYLKLEYLTQETINVNSLPIQNGCNLPSASSPVTMATVQHAQVLTTETAVKKTLSVQLDITDCDLKYQPGDSISVVCPNERREVTQLLKRLDIEDQADVPYSMSVLPDTKKRNASIPKHVPARATLRHLFTTCLDIRDAPKKALLRVLVEHTGDDLQKRRLQELCSKQGNEDYAMFLRAPSISLLDLLNTFTSCHPPVERLIEHLPRLQPRPYSICSSPLVTPGSIEIVFNVVDIHEGEGRTYDRSGVCTGWINSQTKNLQTHVPTEEGCDLEGQMETLSLETPFKVPIFSRTSQHFHLPEDQSIPVIMVGPGTGVSPFVGFLRHRKALRDMSDDQPIGETWLFFGCRHKDRDFIFRSELADLCSMGILTKFCVSFSRDEQPEGSPKYVQDNIRLHADRLVQMIDEQNAVVYVCGDAKNMAKSVNEAFMNILSSVKGLSTEEARSYLMQMRLKKKYLEDVWT